MKSRDIENVPGGTSFYNAFTQNAQGIKPLYEVRVPSGEIVQDMQEIEGRIKTAFFVDLFFGISSTSRPEDMKAQVALQIDKEKLLLLGPVLTQLDDGWLNPLIDKLVAFAAKAGVLPDPPDDIVGENLDIEYISTLANAQKSVSIGNMEKLTFLASQFAVFDPTVPKRLDFDAALKEAAAILNVIPEMVKSDKDTAAAKQQEIDQQNAALGIQSAVEGAGAVKDLANAPVGSGNALEALGAGIG